MINSSNSIIDETVSKHRVLVENLLIILEGFNWLTRFSLGEEKIDYIRDTIYGLNTNIKKVKIIKSQNKRKKINLLIKENNDFIKSIGVLKKMNEGVRN